MTMSSLSPTMSPGWCKRLLGRMLKIRALIMRSQNRFNHRSNTTNKMSSNSLTTLVPVLDGTNYRRWAELMKAYLQQQGSWIMIDLFGAPTPLHSTPKVLTAAK